MTKERFLDLLYCKFGFHDWQDKIYLVTDEWYDRGTYLYSTDNGYKLCKVCLKKKKV